MSSFTVPIDLAQWALPPGRALLGGEALKTTTGVLLVVGPRIFYRVGVGFDSAEVSEDATRVELRPAPPPLVQQALREGEQQWCVGLDGDGGALELVVKVPGSWYQLPRCKISPAVSLTVDKVWLRDALPEQLTADTGATDAELTFVLAERHAGWLPRGPLGVRASGAGGRLEVWPGRGVAPATRDPLPFFLDPAAFEWEVVVAGGGGRVRIVAVERPGGRMFRGARQVASVGFEREEETLVGVASVEWMAVEEGRPVPAVRCDLLGYSFAVTEWELSWNDAHNAELLVTVQPDAPGSAVRAPLVATRCPPAAAGEWGAEAGAAAAAVQRAAEPDGQDAVSASRGAAKPGTLNKRHNVGEQPRRSKRLAAAAPTGTVTFVSR